MARTNQLQNALGRITSLTGGLLGATLLMLSAHSTGLQAAAMDSSGDTPKQSPRRPASVDHVEMLANSLRAPASDSRVAHTYTRKQLDNQRLMNAASTFNEDEYLMMYPDVAADLRSGKFDSATAHYWKVGAKEGRNPSLLFNEAHYLKKNPDVAALIAKGDFVSGFQHFQQFGASEGREYRPNFNEIAYLNQNPEVAAAVKNGKLQSGLLHYVTSGRREMVGQIGTFARID